MYIPVYRPLSIKGEVQPIKSTDVRVVLTRTGKAIKTDRRNIFNGIIECLQAVSALIAFISKDCNVSGYYPLYLLEPSLAPTNAAVPTVAVALAAGWHAFGRSGPHG